ncbi:MAG: tRNA lysidine(34) synthetase TilS [Treponema sp.]|nr:tRNA lysidine(34) synthetase TilS [Treponema sp.]
MQHRFEKNVLKGLSLCGVSSTTLTDHSYAPEGHFLLGAAVSGGADSVSLLLGLVSLFGSEKIRVITVDHGIRSTKESGGDALFVKNLCEKMGVRCKIFKIESGLIEKTARAQKKSTEETAREMRYSAFESFIEEEKLSFLCLAHNQNDQLETVLMRFLQGSGSEGLIGIARSRGKYIRPLLDISRSEIEEYLTEKKQVWRTDSTNSDTKYLRNKVRNVLIPVLNENFCGWQKAVLTGAKKAEIDEGFLKNQAKECLADSLLPTQTDAATLTISRENFYSLPPALARRIFVSDLNRLGFGGRFPFHLIEEVLSWKNEKNHELTFENIRISLDSEKLQIKHDSEDSEKKRFTDGGFSFILEKAGDKCEIGDFLAKVTERTPENETGPEASHSESRKIVSRGKITVSPKIPGLPDISFESSLPVIVRSAIPGDEIRTADGKLKSVSDIFNDWKVPEKLRGTLPIFEELGKNGRITALLGEYAGFKNWIVR